MMRSAHNKMHVESVEIPSLSPTVRSTDLPSAEHIEVDLLPAF